MLYFAMSAVSPAARSCVVETGKFEGEGGLLYAGGCVGANLGAVEPAAGGPDGNVGKSQARRSSDAIEVVLLYAAAERSRRSGF